MGFKSALVFLFMFTVALSVVDAWSGNYCVRTVCRYRYVRVCRYRWWGSCCSWAWRRVGYWATEYFCCTGWKHNGNKACNIPVCTPRCQNGGTCIRPGLCACPSTHTGYRCTSAVCSYNSPCFPGTCVQSDSCDCSSGFTSVLPVNKANYCLKIEDNTNVDLRLTEMQVRLSYWPRYKSPSMEYHWVVADSTNETTMDVYWTNRRNFNRLETTSTSQYFPPALTERPKYVSGYKFGIVHGIIEVWLLKLKHGGSGVPEFSSLNKTITCLDTVSSISPSNDVYNCSVSDHNFDRFLEHRDALKITFKSKGGGYRQLYNPDSRSNITKQSYLPVQRELAVEFRFDFLMPTHCEINGTCTSGESMLSVPDITRDGTISITWRGWQDEDSQMNRYAWEVFPMTKTIDGELVITKALALSPLQPPKEVMAANYTPQTFDLPGPGMYSVILEAGDLANNSIFSRRLVLYDPDPKITSDPAHDLYVTTASEAVQYRYQHSLQRPVVVWEKHFRNARHEDNALLGAVRAYPIELEDSPLREGTPRFRKVIHRETKMDDHEGTRTVEAILNKRGIVKFWVQYARARKGGRYQPQTPTSKAWIDLGIDTNFTVPFDPSEGDTVTVWVKATDVMGTERVNRTQVTFDITPPKISRAIQFTMNVPVAGIPFSSQFVVQTKDDESGIAYIDWTFTRLSNNSVIYRQRVEGITAPGCTDFQTCSCTTTGRCFSYTQILSLSNCHMMVEKENLATEVINVTADITNMAGLVTQLFMLKGDLTKLNGTEAYYPPQNIKVIDITRESVTVTWSFPPSCFPRTGLWVIVNDVKHAVHKDARNYALTGLSAGTTYTIYMVTDYSGDVQSDRASFKFSTEEEVLSVGAIIGIIIAFLLVALIVALIIIFVLWRRGKIFQKEGTPVNKQLHRVSRAFDNVRKTVRGHGRSDTEMGAFQNNAYRPDADPDEIYLYGSMAFQTRQAWQLDESSLTLLDHVAEGRFATIYKATWTHDGKRQDTVAAKMLKAGFSQDDAMKMMAKINFMATQLDDHPNVIKFLGAVTDNQGWGPVLVMEYCESGQMDKWLTQNRSNMSEQIMENLFRFSHGIAKGMEYIASKKITHKRLAARNILLNFLLEPKVAGFGPQHKEGTEDKATRVPAKWAAPEVLQEKPPTEKSDVWSYGIVLWEIFSMGQVPYPGIHAGEIGTRLKSGYRMDKPEFADDMHYDLMKTCWEYKQSKRPTFSTIRAQLGKLFSPGNRQSTDFYYDTNQLNG